MIINLFCSVDVRRLLAQFALQHGDAQARALATRIGLFNRHAATKYVFKLTFLFAVCIILNNLKSHIHMKKKATNKHVHSHSHIARALYLPSKFPLFNFISQLRYFSGQSELLEKEAPR